MGCSASSGADEPSFEGAVASGKQNKILRRLSVAPKYVKENPSSPLVGDPELFVNLTPEQQQAKDMYPCVGLTRKGYVPQNSRKQNQDRALVKYCLGKDPGMHLFAVMDGHGECGHHVSSFVKARLPHFLERQNLRGDDPEGAIKQAIVEMCKELRDSEMSTGYSGTTLVFGIIIDNMLYSCNIGDSRCVFAKYVDTPPVIKQEEQEKPEGRERQSKEEARQSKEEAKPVEYVTIELSNDHKPDSLLEKERIVAAGGRVEPLPNMPKENAGPMRVWLMETYAPGLAMSRSIGDAVSHQIGVISVPEIVKFDLTNQQGLLVWVSDGVTEFLTSEQVCELVWKEKNNLIDAANILVKKSITRWHKEEHVVDDITCVILDWNLMRTFNAVSSSMPSLA